MKSATVAVLIAALLNTAAAAPQFPHSYVTSRAEPGAPQYGAAGQPALPVANLGLPTQVQSLTNGLHLAPKDLSQLGSILSYFQNGNGRVPGDLTGIVTKLLGLGADDTVKRVLQTVMHLCGQPSEEPKPMPPPPADYDPNKPGSKSSDSKTPDSETSDSKTPDSKAPDSKAPDSKAPDSKAPYTKVPYPKDSDSKSTDTPTPDSKEPAAGSPQPKESYASPNKSPATAAGGPLGGGPGPINAKDLIARISTLLKVPQALVEKILMTLGLGGSKGPLSSLAVLPGSLTSGAGPLAPVTGALGSVSKLTGGLTGGPKGVTNALPVEALPQGLKGLGGGLASGAALPLPGGALATADAKGNAHP